MGKRKSDEELAAIASRYNVLKDFFTNEYSVYRTIRKRAYLRVPSIPYFREKRKQSFFSLFFENIYEIFFLISEKSVILCKQIKRKENFT